MEKPTKTARQLLDMKHRTGAISVPVSGTVLDALKTMAQHDIGAVLVMDGDRLVGIFSERDYARKGILEGRAASATPVREVMTSKVISVTPDQSVEICRKIMAERRIRHLPVLQGERVLGVLSSKDILDEIIAEDEKVIEQLETERAMTDRGLY